MSKGVQIFSEQLHFIFLLPATFLISKGKLLKIVSPNNTLFNKWLSLLDEGIYYFFVLCLNCDFYCLLGKDFCFEPQTLIKITYIVIT